MKIHLLRHAKTNQYSETGNDIDRSLLEKGIKQAKKLADYIQDMDFVDIHCSSSRRTRQTFDLVFKNKPYSSIHFSEELYLCSAKELLAYINDLTAHKDIFIIGHNNGIADFASYISDQDLHFKTAAYMCFDVQIDHWSTLSIGTAKLIEAFRPEVD